MKACQELKAARWLLTSLEQLTDGMEGLASSRSANACASTATNLPESVSSSRKPDRQQFMMMLRVVNEGEHIGNTSSNQGFSISRAFRVSKSKDRRFFGHQTEPLKIENLSGWHLDSFRDP